MHFETEESLDRFIARSKTALGPSPTGSTRIISRWPLTTSLRTAATKRWSVPVGTFRRYNEAQGGENTEDSGYHETLTVFWIDVVTAALPPGKSRLEAIHHIVETLAPQRDLWREFYSFDVVKSREARRAYIAPDL